VKVRAEEFHRGRTGTSLLDSPHPGRPSDAVRETVTKTACKSAFLWKHCLSQNQCVSQRSKCGHQNWISCLIWFSFDDHTL